MTAHAADRPTGRDLGRSGTGMTRRRLLGGLLGGAATALALGATGCVPQTGPWPSAVPMPPGQPAQPVPDLPVLEATRRGDPTPAPLASEPATTERRGLEDLLAHLGVGREEFEPVETRYFAGLRELLAWHGMLEPNEPIDRERFDEPIRRFQRARALPESGLPDDATLWALGSDRARARQLELESVEADLVAGRPSLDRFELRQDAASRYRQLRAALSELGGVVTSAGAFRELDAGPTPGRPPVSPQHLGLAFDLAPSSGMQSPESDPYLITQEVAGWRVWARAERGSEKVLTAIFWRRGKPIPEEVKARVVDFTALAQQHGFRGIGASSGFPQQYAAAEWWHFRCEELLTPFLSQLGVELLSLRRYSEEALRAVAPVWERRTDRFVFDRDRGSWRFAGVGPPITAEAAARYYGIVSDEIRRTLREYQQLALAVPATDPLEPTVGQPERPPTELVVRTPYWINDAEDAEQRAKQVASAHPDLQRAFKAAPVNGRYAKGSPAEIRATVEGALATGRIRRAGDAWSPRRGDIEAWMNAFGVGVDCSGFVYEAQTRIEQALSAESMGQLAVARLGPPTYVGTEHAKQGQPVRRPRDLSVGDLMHRPSRPSSPISHVRIVDSVAAVGDGIVFTTAESTWDANGPRTVRWRFPDAATLANLEWQVDARWERAEGREQEDTFWRHLPLMRAGLTTLV